MKRNYNLIDALMIDKEEREMMGLLTDGELAIFMRALINKADGKQCQELTGSEFSDRPTGLLAKTFFTRCIERLEYYRSKKRAALKRWEKQSKEE